MNRFPMLRFLSIVLSLSLFFDFTVSASSTTNSSFLSNRTIEKTFTSTGGDSSNGGWVGSVALESNRITFAKAFDTIQDKLPDNAINVRYSLTRALLVLPSGKAIANNGVSEAIPSFVLDAWKPPKYYVTFYNPSGSFLRSITYGGEESYPLNYTPSFIRDMSMQVLPINSVSSTTIDAYGFVIDGSNGYYLPFPKISLVCRLRYQLTATYDLSATAIDDINKKMDTVISDLEIIDDSVNRVDQSIGVTNEKLDDVNNNLSNIADKQQEQIDQNQQFRDEDRNDANQMGDQLNDFTNSMQSTVKSKWEILFYPIKFTNDLLSVFVDGTNSRSYKSKYLFVAGYTYNADTGGLDPIIDYSRAIAPRVGGGTTITFPAYTLPVLNVKLWDSYSFDLSTIKSSFPALFNLCYIVVGVSEIYAFVAFLRSKYDEVFG